MSVVLPTRFGKFTLRRKLGAGAMAEVYLAEVSGADGFRRLVALKRILPSYSLQQDFVRSFISEARLAGNLHHSNIVPALEFGCDGDDYYLVMDYVDGLTLSQLLVDFRHRQERLPLSIVLDIARQLCDGLAYAHAARDPEGRPLNMIHRDLKPGNILLSQYGEVKITDFGVAKASSNLHQTTIAGQMVKGTIAYMSPEQARCEELDPRSDLYALGAILFELVTLEMLYNNAAGLPGLFKVQQGQVQERLNLLEGAPVALVNVIRRLLESDRTRRFNSALEVRRALQDVAAHASSAEIDLAEAVRETMTRVGSASQPRALADVAALPSLAAEPEVETVKPVDKAERRPPDPVAGGMAASRLEPARPAVDQATVPLRRGATARALAVVSGAFVLGVVVTVGWIYYASSNDAGGGLPATEGLSGALTRQTGTQDAGSAGHGSAADVGSADHGSAADVGSAGNGSAPDGGGGGGVSTDRRLEASSGAAQDTRPGDVGEGPSTRDGGKTDAIGTRAGHTEAVTTDAGKAGTLAAGVGRAEAGDDSGARQGKGGSASRRGSGTSAGRGTGAAGAGDEGGTSERDVSHRAGMQPSAAESEPSGRLVVNSLPRDQVEALLIDGDAYPTGKPVMLPEGEHRFSVRWTNGMTRTRTVQVTAGQTKYCTFSLFDADDNPLAEPEYAEKDERK